MTRTILLAVHPDDELIGCHRLLTAASPNSIDVIYIERDRASEAKSLGQALGHNVFFPTSGRVSGILRVLARLSLDPDSIILAPDPHWETHPVHRSLGAQALIGAEQFGLRFVTYSTNMRAPYLQELRPDQAQAKRELLDKFFPSQKTLWEYDHRYFLFEGLCEWNPRIV